MNSVNVGVVIPVYNHENAIGATVAALEQFGLPCILVDDGSRPECAARMALLAEQYPWVEVVTRPDNGGKGAAVMSGFERAAERGFSHVLQLDADGQHDSSDIPHFLELARRHPEAVITGQPMFDASAPKARRYGRYVCHVWVWINTLSFEIRDAMCGFRVYPLDVFTVLMRSRELTRRMDFDVEVLVRLHWQGLSVINLPTHVGYPLDGVSYFQPFADNARITRLHILLFFGMVRRLPVLLSRRLLRVVRYA